MWYLTPCTAQARELPHNNACVNYSRTFRNTANPDVKMLARENPPRSSGRTAEVLLNLKTIWKNSPTILLNETKKRNSTIHWTVVFIPHTHCPQWKACSPERQAKECSSGVPAYPAVRPFASGLGSHTILPVCLLFQYLECYQDLTDPMHLCWARTDWCWADRTGVQIS